MKSYNTFFILIYGNHNHHCRHHLLHHISNVFILFLQCAWECLNWIQEWVMYMFITSQGFLRWKNPNLLVCRSQIFHTALFACSITGSLYVYMNIFHAVLLFWSMFCIPAIYYTINAWCFSFHVVNVNVWDVYIWFCFSSVAVPFLVKFIDLFQTFTPTTFISTQIG